MSKARKIPILDIPVEFGGVSIGETTAKLGLKLARDVCNINTADETFTGKRLSVVVLLGGSHSAQGELFEAAIDVTATVDVKRIGVTVDTITTGLTFNLETLDVATLAKFSKGSGRLRVFAVDELPEPEPEQSDNDDDD